MTDAVSVVVPTRDRPDILDRCLAALRGAVRDGDEIVVVDSASDGDATADVAQRHGVRYVRAALKGASLARNIGWQAAHNELVAFTDDDTQPQPGWTGAIAAAFVDPSIGFVSGAIRPTPGVPTPGPVPNMYDEAPFALTPERRGALGASANLAVRRAVLEAVGGFDDDLGPGRFFRAAEDADLFDRMFLAGARGVYEPSAEVRHDQWRNRREMLRLDYGYGLGMGARLARLWRTDRARARVQIRDLLWLNGLRHTAHDLRDGKRLEAATGALRFLGEVIAFPVAMVRLPATPAPFPRAQR